MTIRSISILTMIFSTGCAVESSISALDKYNLAEDTGYLDVETESESTPLKIHLNQTQTQK